MPATLPDRSVWTADDLAELPQDGQRYEILHGELIVGALPVPRHQRATVRLATLFELASRNMSMTVMAPAEVHLSATTVLQPDLAIYAVREAELENWRTMEKPALVIEMLSPSNRKYDRHRKRPEYLSHGIREVWTVDTDARAIERWTAASEFPTTERHDFDFQLTPAHPALRITLQTVFGTLAA